MRQVGSTKIYWASVERLQEAKGSYSVMGKDERQT